MDFIVDFEIEDKDGWLTHGFSTIVRIQMLSELEEIIRYNDHKEEPERQATQRKTWSRR